MMDLTKQFLDSELLWLTIFIILNLSIVFLNAKRFLKANAILNFLFLTLISLIIFIQISNVQSIKSDIEAVGFIPVAGRVMIEALHSSSDKIVGIAIYFFTNQVLTYIKLSFWNSLNTNKKDKKSE